jgi:hypothetical protein
MADKVQDDVQRALFDADDISGRIHAGGYRANLSDVERLRNHVRRLASVVPDDGRADMAARFADLERCTEVGHAHLWTSSRRAVAAVHNAADALVAAYAVEGFHFPTNGQFGALEGELYRVLLDANPADRPDLLTCETYGRASRPVTDA